MLDTVIEVQQVSEDQWESVRVVRLHALSLDPQAFGSSYAREINMTETEWRARLQQEAWFLAFDGTKPVGVVAGTCSRSGDLQKRELIAMWVAAQYRHRGIAAQLIGKVIEWAGSQGATQLNLTVADTNIPARRLYERLGFVTTDEQAPLLPDLTRRKERIRMRLCISGSL